MSMPRRSSMCTPIKRLCRKRRLPLPNENDPHQTFANRDPQHIAASGHQVPNRAALLRQQAPHTSMINRQGVACAPIGQTTTVSGCRTPRSSHRRPDNPGTFRAPPSLNIGLHALHLKGQFRHHVVDEGDGGLLVAAGVDAQHPEPGAVVDGGELVELAPATGPRSLGEVKAAKNNLNRGAQPGVRRVRTSSSATRMSLMLLFWETRRRTLKACSGSMV